MEKTPDTEPKSAKKMSRRPIWAQTINRVECVIFPFPHGEEISYSIGLTRSFFDKKANAVKRVPYYDRADLADVVTAAKAADDFLKSRDAYKGNL